MTNMKWEVEAQSIHSWSDDGLSFASHYHSESGHLEGGFEVVISSHEAEAHRGSEFGHDGLKRMTQKRLHVKVNSRGHDRLAKNIIGGGYIYDEYIDAELNLPHELVRDVVHELRFWKGSLRMRLDGYEISEKVFRATYFRLFPDMERWTFYPDRQYYPEGTNWR